MYKVENGGRTDYATVRAYDFLGQFKPITNSITDLYSPEEVK